MGIEEEKNPAPHRSLTQNLSVLRHVLYSCWISAAHLCTTSREKYRSSVLTSYSSHPGSDHTAPKIFPTWTFLWALKKVLENNTQKYSIVEFSIKIYPSFEICVGINPLILAILVSPLIDPVIGCSKNKINLARLEKEFKKHVKKCCKKQLLEPNWGGVKANFHSCRSLLEIWAQIFQDQAKLDLSESRMRRARAWDVLPSSQVEPGL